jgi:hypothetical protein
MSDTYNAYPGVKGRIQSKDDRVTVDGDIIGIQVENIPAAPDGSQSAQIRLALAQDMTWWKMLQVFVVDHEKGTRKIVGEVLYGSAELQDDRKGPALALDYHLLQGGQPPETFELRFWKAKFLGIHTRMENWVMNGTDVLGKRITFTWMTD